MGDDHAGIRAGGRVESMANQLGFYIIAGRCVECHACEVACKELNNVALGIRWRKVRNHWDGQFPNPTNISMSSACMHCEKPACLEVCPTHAITKRAEDGIVVVNQSECIGCRACGSACPYGVPQYGHDSKMQKCNLCLERLEKGKEPVCVSTCPGEALGFGPVDEFAKSAAGKLAIRLEGSTGPAFFVVGSAIGPNPEVYIDTFFRKS